MKQQFIINRRKPGRPKADLAQLTYAFRLYQETNFTVKEICRKSGVSRSSLYRYIKQQERGVANQ